MRRERTRLYRIFCKHGLLFSGRRSSHRNLYRSYSSIFATYGLCHCLARDKIGFDPIMYRSGFHDIFFSDYETCHQRKISRHICCYCRVSIIGLLEHSILANTLTDIPLFRLFSSVRLAHDTQMDSMYQGQRI